MWPHNEASEGKRSTGADEAGVQKVSARTLSRTFVQGPGQGQGLESQGPGPGPGLFLKDQDKDKDFTLVLKESLGQGQGQGLTSLRSSRVCWQRQ